MRESPHVLGDMHRVLSLSVMKAGEMQNVF